MDKAFNGLGGVTALMKWAKDNETEFYKLWGRRIKAEVAHDVSGKVGIVILPSVK